MNKDNLYSEEQFGTTKIQLTPYGEYFMSYLEGYKNRDIDLQKIRVACKKMELDFMGAGKTRRNGEGYETHLYEVTSKYIEFAGENLSTESIIACLFHDSVEDLNETYNFESLSGDFGPKVAFLVYLMSKPQIEIRDTVVGRQEMQEMKNTRNKNFFSNFKDLKTLEQYFKKEATRLKYKIAQENSDEENELKKGTITLAIIKICDRVHNLYHMENFSSAEMKKKIIETELYLTYLSQELCRNDTGLLDLLRKALIYRIIGSTEKEVQEKIEEKD